MRISDWSSDVCSSDLFALRIEGLVPNGIPAGIGVEIDFAAFDQGGPDRLRRTDMPLFRRTDKVVVRVTERLRQSAEVSGHTVGDRQRVRLGKECVSTCRSRWAPYA